MRSGRSARACQRCRQRRVKCDKTLPTCVRCANFGQPCPGYPLFKTFIDQGNQARARVTRRQDRAFSTPQHTSYIEISPANATEASLLSPLATLSHDSRAVSSSNYLSNPQETTLCIDESVHSVSLDTNERTDGIEYFDLDIESYYADGNNACGFFADLGDTEAQDTHFTISDVATTVSDARTNQGTTGVQSHFQLDDFEEDPLTVGNESALLMQLFVEMLAPWMDLFDLEAYFTRIVPHNASKDILLKFALKAIAAKQTARYAIKHHPAKFSKLFDLVLSEYPNDNSDQWFYRAASYYDQGISCLRSRLQLRVGRYGISETRDMARRNSGQATPSTQLHISSPTERLQDRAKILEQNLFLAVSIFSFYETLDECFAKPSQHLSGFLALIEHSDTSSPRSEARFLFASKSTGRAAFWYFVRKDMFNSYAQSVKPAFDPENHPLWVAAGLPDELFLIQSNESCESGYENIPSFYIAEDLNNMTHILIWLSVRVVKMIGTNDKAQLDGLEEHISPLTSTSFRQAQTEEEDAAYAVEWTSVRNQLRWWFKSRPEIFHAYASYRANFATAGGLKIKKANLFTTSTGAATMQIFHFIQILLLLNQPSAAARDSNQASKLRMLKKNAEEIEFHSLEICAIATEMPAFAVQRQMSHPLQLAGMYLDSPQDQSIISKTLDAILMETCCPNKSLMQGQLGVP